MRQRYSATTKLPVRRSSSPFSLVIGTWFFFFAESTPYTNVGYTPTHLPPVRKEKKVRIVSSLYHQSLVTKIHQ